MQASTLIPRSRTARNDQDAKSLQGFGGADVLAIHASHRSDTYRVAYTIDFSGVVYVLHAFKKKSTKGDEIPRPDRELIETRFKAARALHAERMER